MSQFENDLHTPERTNKFNFQNERVDRFANTVRPARGFRILEPENEDEEANSLYL